MSSIDSHLTLVTPENAGEFPAQRGIESAYFGWLTPIDFVTIGPNTVCLNILYQRTSLFGRAATGLVPHMEHVIPRPEAVPEGDIYSFRHKEPGASDPERVLRILRVVGPEPPQEHQPSEIRYGQLPGYPEGFYLGAEQVGHMDLGGTKPDLVTLGLVSFEYLPIGVARG